VNLIYNQKLTDEATGYKLIRKDLVKSLKLKKKGFGFCIELTIELAKREIPIHEVPISYEPRSFRQGKKIKAIDGLRAIWLIFRERIS
jgi:hypothetical protein